MNGQATLTVPSLPIGPNQITVTAVNTATSGTITSPPTLVTVAKATIAVTLSSSENPSNPSQTVIFSATVHAGATGSVTFLDGTTVLGLGTVNAAGVATFSTSTLTIGSHPITASYGGDSGYIAATSATLTQVVGQIPTVTTIVGSAPAQLLHTGVTFTANVTAPSPNATGTITFMDGTVVIGTATLTANGGVVVSLTTNANAAYATTEPGNWSRTRLWRSIPVTATSLRAPRRLLQILWKTSPIRIAGAASQNVIHQARPPRITSPWRPSAQRFS